MKTNILRSLAIVLALAAIGYLAVANAQSNNNNQQQQQGMGGCCS